MRNLAMLTAAAVCFLLLVPADPPLADQFANTKKEYEARERQFDADLRAAGRDREKLLKAHEDRHAFVTQQADRLITGGED